MDTPPKLTDRNALARNRHRAREFFLQEAAADDVNERLSEINRTFKNPAVVTGFPDFWKKRWPEAMIINDDALLNLENGAYDLIVHAMALHWADDPVGQIVQCRRALRPDGLFIGTLCAGQTLHELRAALAQAESDIRGGLSPRVLPMSDLRDLGGLLQRAGLALPVADIWPLTASYASAFHLMHDLRAMGETNAMAQRLRHFSGKSILARAADIYQANFSDDDGRVTATFEIATLTGWAPDESQPKPLRPGSATLRLADVLGATERPLPGSTD